MLAATLSDELRSCDHRATIASDGGEALAVADRDQFDAAVLDRMLPSTEPASNASGRAKSQLQLEDAFGFTAKAL